MTKTVRPSHDRLEGLLDQQLRLGVDVRGGLVEDQDARVAQDGAGERDALPLAAARARAALADLGVVAVRQRAMNSWAWARARPPRSRSSVASGRP